MSTPQLRPVLSLRRVPLMGWFGVLTLVASSVIAAGALGLDRSQKPAVPTTSESMSTVPTRDRVRAACFGFVDVEQGVTPLYPVQPGRVVKVLTKEGATVEAGTPLFQIDDAMAKFRLEEAKKALVAAETRLAQAQTLRSQHGRKVEAQQAAIEVARKDVEAARNLRDKARRFFKDNIGGTEEDVKAAEAAVEKAEAGVKAQEAQLAVLNAFDTQMSITLAEQDVGAKQIDIEKAKLGVKECTVTAPAKGSVLRLSVSPGEVLGPTPRQPALLFCADVPRIVRAEIEQEFADHVTLGQTTSIQDDATASGNWTGKVIRLSDWYTHRRSILLEPMQYNDVRTLECIIQLTPGQAPLRIGQRVRVTLGSVES